MKLSAITGLISLILVTGSTGQAASAEAAAITASANAETPDVDQAKFLAYVEQLKIQARAQGIAQSTIDDAFAHVHFLNRIIQSDKNQLEKKITLDIYLQKVLPDTKIVRAREMHKTYSAQLARASERSGVPANYIVALWGMESGFGKSTGKEDVISALSTLAFEGRREEFFTKQLMAALSILQQKHVSVAQLKGSWAGAMGQCQFMPTSFIQYGADGDGDGHIDIWNSIDDVFASTANYLATEGWNNKEGWGQEVKATKAIAPSLIGLDDDKAKTVIQWQKLGIVTGNKALPGQKAWIVQPDDAQGRTFMVYNNFRTIMHWNRSLYFAISIGMLAEKVGQN
ncbi:lytic murein transglycosylase [Budvicia diplopodorum]|uniref:lytic murein transglycosylase n=1 Tax=Budvicia diplopodorum TaxID=1119056 RepID=UPI00135957E8|nr:lytic murein transglycosylase [Budvicia diplopodorum]